MKKPEYIQLMVQTAIMYYRDEMTQQKIAKTLGITRQTVSKLIQESRQCNIVDIRINNPLKDIDDIAVTLKTIYGLKNAIVILSNFTDENLIRTVISQKAADYITTLIKDNN